MLRCFRLVAVLAILFPALVSAQTIPAVGTDATLDVATWNIEHFGNGSSGPSNEPLQFRNVLAVMRQAEIDIWGLQELDIEEDFTRLLDSLGTGYNGFWQADNTGFDIGYGFVWDTSVITPLSAITTILEGSSFEFASRPPIQMRARVTLPDTTLEVRFIDLHMKAGGSTSDYDRRLAASGILKNYVDNLQAVNAHVIILGDLNDELIQSISGGRTSPYQNFLDDPTYLFATRAFDQPGSGDDVNTFCSSSTCSSGSVLDHIITTANLIDDYEEDSTARLSSVLSQISNYTNTTSDHLPVFARFDFPETPISNEPEGPGRAFALRAPFPNPFTDEATFTYTLDRPGAVRLELFDALGRRVALVVDNEYRAAGSYRVRVNGNAFAPGLYIVRLSANGQTTTRRLVRGR